VVDEREQAMPICQRCQKPVSEFSVGKDFRRGHLFFFESRCHGDTERVEYRPTSPNEMPFEPTRAFPADKPPQVALEPTVESEEHPMTIQDELMAMPEWKTLERIRNLGTSIRLLERNAEETLELLRFLTEDPKSWSLSDVRNRVLLDSFFEEMLRRLHNFVVAALTLVDHSRNLNKELYAQRGLFPEYQAEVERRFVNDPLVQFVQKLRHLAQHRRLRMFPT